MSKPLRLAAVAVAITLAAGAALAQEMKLNIGNVLDPAHPINVGARRMKEVAEKESNGRLKIELFPSSQLGSQREMWQNTQAGVIGGVIDATAFLANFVKEAGVLDLPYLATNADEAFKLLDGPVIEQEIVNRAAAAGFRVVNFWEVSFRHVYTRTPVSSIADLKGRKMRVIPNPTFVALFRSFGSAPTPMAFGELYTALQQGVVDGAENDLVTYLSTKHYEVAKNLAITNHMMLVNTFVLSEKQWQRFPDDIKAVLRKASLEGRRAVAEDRRTREAKALDDLRAAGVNVTRPELKPFVDAGKKTYGESEERLGKDLVAKVTAAIGK